MQVPAQLYLTESKFRLFFFSFSLLFCLLIVLTYHEAIFFLETYNFSGGEKKFYYYKYHRTILNFYVYLYVYSLCNKHTIRLLSFQSLFYSSWYKSQIQLFRMLLVGPLLLFISGLFICHIILIPLALSFFSTWNITVIYTLDVQLEARIQTYTYWTLQIAFYLSNFLFFSLFKLLRSYIDDGMISLHFFFRKNRKYFLVFIYICTSLLLPPEGLVQLLLLLSILALTEVFFLITCIFFVKNNV
uniref:SecY-independent transporter protein n=1 Tax=Wildemania schizophylla TaxID=1134705 RepID=A0A068F595_WILSC|nr:SecY-independent transporter protein [Wildemania schizophylla]AID57269.1 SecY-independent transporter protein [Wildemania schizophylla]